MKKYLLLFFFTLFIFRNWFSLKIITAADYAPGWLVNGETVYSSSLTVWNNLNVSGLGRPQFFSLWVDSYTQNLPNFLRQAGLPVFLIQRLIFFLPFLILSLFSGYFLWKRIFPESKNWGILSSSLYTFNTYFLMIFSGGQVSVALSFLLAPLTFLSFLSLEKSSLISKEVMLAGLITGVQLLLDPRIAALALAAVILFLLISRSLSFILSSVMVVLIGVLLNAFWILPLILNFGNSFSKISSVYTDSGAVKFFSFAKFEETISLLHPNWPENIFGKTYFMRWEFLIVPILAYSGLLFLKNNKKTMILFFALLGLIGAFLAKGVNEPFGFVYEWLFQYFPGFKMFRDPTKFYLFIALSYSILIPYSVWKIYDWIKAKGKQNYLPKLFLLSVICCLLFLIRPAWAGELGGTFKSREAPQEYLELKNFISSQPEFFRTLWIPKTHSYAYFSNLHPALDAGYLLEKKGLPPKEELQRWAVKYVIIPFDDEGKIFLNDRKYDQEQRLVLEKELDKIPYLNKLNLVNWFNDLYHPTRQDGIVVYEINNYKDHFWLEDSTVLRRTVEREKETGKIKWKMIKPTKYLVTVKNLNKPTVLMFSETFDQGWVAKIGSEEIFSQKALGMLNRFKLNKIGDYEIMVEYKPQRYVEIGLIIGGLAFLAILLFPKLGDKLYNSDKSYKEKKV